MNPNRTANQSRLKKARKIDGSIFQPRFLWFTGGLVAALMVAVLASLGGRQMSVGIADNFFMYEDPRGRQAAKDLRLTSVRVWVWRKPGQSSLTAEQRAMVKRSLTSGRRVFVTVTGEVKQVNGKWVGAPGINTRLERRRYQMMLRDLVRRFPKVKDVSVWNEPNLPLFWAKNRDDAPARYAALLAASYDNLHPRGVRVYGFELHPWRETARWVSGVGWWMRWSGRRRPLFNAVATHPYPMVGKEAPWARHKQPGALSMGDVRRLRSLLKRTFAGTAQRNLNIFYTESGWTTAPTSARRVTPQLQAARMVQAVELAYCQPGVRSFMSFLVADDTGAWQTGVVAQGYSAHKLAYAAYKSAIARVRAGRVNCAKFPLASR